MFTSRVYKFCLILPLIIFQTQVNANKLLPNWKEVTKKCAKNLSPQDAATILHTKFVPTKDDHKCFLECVYTEMGIIKDNQLNWDIGAEIAKRKFGDDTEKLTKLKIAFNMCNEKVFTDTKEKCAIGRLLRDCFYNNPPTSDFQKY